MMGQLSRLLCTACVVALCAAPPAADANCVKYVRTHSDFELKGDAWKWWAAAEGHYPRSHSPESGSILVFKRHGKMKRGHVALVNSVLGPREILIDHANWAVGRLKKGRVDKGVRVIDVSENNDWSLLKVWYGPADQMGDSTYPAYGFILPQQVHTVSNPGIQSQGG